MFRLFVRRPGVAASLTICSALLGSITALMLIPSNERTVSAEDFFTSIPDALPVRVGQYIHTRTEIWNRYGPKASSIEEAGQGPENLINESWSEVGSGSVVVRALTTLADTAGTVFQSASLGPHGSRTIDPRSGKVLSESSSQTSPPLNGQAQQAERLQAAISSGSGWVIAQSDSSLTLELRENPQPYLSDDDPADFAIPYVSDLAPVEYIRRITLNQIGVVTLDEMYVLTDDGHEILVARSATVLEILDAVPAGILEEA